MNRNKTIQQAGPAALNRKKKLLKWTGFILLCLLLSAPWSLAQQSTLNERLKDMSFMSGQKSDYRLGPGDLVQFSVFGVEEFNKAARVSETGEIMLPLIGAIRVEGLSVPEAEIAIEEALAAGELLVEPDVTLFVQEYLSRPVYVLGMVQRPGQYHMRTQMKLVDVLAMAGGLIEERFAGKALIQRGGDTPEGESLEVDLRRLLEMGDMSLNHTIRGGDYINVPEKKVDFFYVIGEVTKAGAYEIPRERVMLASQALAQAGGALKTAKRDKGILLRYEADGQREEIPVNFDDIFKGKRPDLMVRANDVIFVPGSTFKTFSYGLLSAVPEIISDVIVFGSVR